MAANSDGITDREINDSVIAIKGGSTETQPGITFRLNWCTDFHFAQVGWRHPHFQKRKFD